ncbi:MAG: DUF2851 family protein [Bacteroidetes bacterium]|nr:DUF2851 family protein [Bacteroidota bacterium]
MTEEFLHYLWRFRLFHPELKTVAGENLTVIHPGEHNRDGGPDFFNARLQIGNTIWAGNVEIHLQASDWYKHHHEVDHAYKNVILHVVDSFDVDVFTEGSKPIPVVEVKYQYRESLLSRYRNLQGTKLWIPCRNIMEVADVGEFVLWAPALAVERLLERSASVRQLLHYSKNDWEGVFFQLLATAFGLKVNAHAFELLAKSLPLKLLLRHRTNFFILEALLFGQAGLLEDQLRETYPQQLLQTYRFYQNKYNLESLQKGIWKFLRMRPGNFPTIRISQLAAMIHGDSNLFDGELISRSLSDWMQGIQATASSYWDTHYTFDKISVKQAKNLGEGSAYLVVINAVTPFLFVYGREKNLPLYLEHAVTLLEEIPGEKSSLVTNWKEIGMPTENALYTQALKQLKSAYCEKKRCLECRIGARLLRGT